jgi:hypothetical protein
MNMVKTHLKTRQLLLKTQLMLVMLLMKTKSEHCGNQEI